MISEYFFVEGWKTNYSTHSYMLSGCHNVKITCGWARTEIVRLSDCRRTQNCPILPGSKIQCFS